LINFYTILSELWLATLWEYRLAISSSIANIDWISLDYTDNSLNENELKIFLNYILKSIWENEINNTQNIEEFKNLFKRKNDFQATWQVYINDIYKKWNSKIEETFLAKYITWFTDFQNNDFQKSIKNGVK
jgi:hypothetical protein